MLTRKVAAALGRWVLRSNGVLFGSKLTLYGVPVVSVAPGSCIEIGSNVVLCSWSLYTALGVTHPVVLRTIVPGAELSIGDHVGISGATICAAKRVVVGRETMLGANVIVADTDFHPISPKNRRYTNDPSKVASAEVVIGENVFIGANSIVLKGVRIGDNAVIGAGSVVTKDVPSNVIAAGNPCRVVKPISTTVKVERGGES